MTTISILYTHITPSHITASHLLWSLLMHVYAYSVIVSPSHTTHCHTLHNLHTPSHFTTLTHHTPSHKEQQLIATQEELKEAQDTVADLSRPPPEIPGADRQELLRLLDRRQHELSTLSEEWKNMASKLEVTSAAKSEFQSRCGLSWVEGGGGGREWREGVEGGGSNNKGRNDLRSHLSPSSLLSSSFPPPSFLSLLLPSSLSSFPSLSPSSLLSLLLPFSLSSSLSQAR